ncbi:MAG: TolC family protein [Deltaproteobacteria bacterium]|nr:TolC family protein [Deltaproteobacteria bacterium]
MKRIARTLAAGLAALALGLPVPARAADSAGRAAAPGGTAGDSREARIAQGATLDDLTAYSYRENPMIEAARQEWRAVVEKYRVDTAYENPEVMVEGMYMQDTFGDRARPDDWKVTVSEPIPLLGRLGTAGAVTEADARIARLKLDATVRDVSVQVRESYEELCYLREAKRVAAANKDLLDQLRKVGETAYAGNRAALVDVMKAQAQSGQLQYDALLLEELERTEKTRLNALLNRAPDAPLGPLADEPVRPVVYSVEELYPLAEANLEEIRIAQAGVEKAQAMLSLTRYENLPEVKLGLSYGEQNLARQIGVQATFMLPVWPGKNFGRTGSARADLEKMRAMRASQINDSRAMIRDTYFRLQNSDRLIRLYRDDLLPQAAKAMETAETWFKQGQGSFSDYVETESAWYNFQLALARAKADYGKFLARLEKLAGRSLTLRAADVDPNAAQEGSK